MHEKHDTITTEEIMKLSVCVGSSCHLKGSYEIINALKAMIAEKGLQEKIELCASFCLGQCENGVTLKADDTFVLGARKENIAELFENKILPLL